MRFFTICLLLLSSISFQAHSSASAPENIDSQLQSLKKEIMQLNRQLFILEEELLYPSSTQFAVYLSVDVGKYFIIDNVELKLDGKTVTHYLYTAREQQALSRGGVQRLYVGNVHSGEHQLTAVFNGIGPNQRPLQRAASINFNKAKEVKNVEFLIRDDEDKQQAQFLAKEW